MRYIAREFVAHKNEVHCEGVWVVMFRHNLSAHLDLEVKQIFGVEKVFL